MQTPLEIIFRGMERSEFLEKDIREKAQKLEKFFSNIISCRVVVEMLQKRHHQGNLFHVTIDLVLPGKVIVVNKEHRNDPAHEDAYVAVRDAFDAARRQLQTYHEKLKRNVKAHEVPPHGRVAKLFPAMDYGLIETSDGREVYFHRNSLLNGDFDKLQEGDTVRFSEEAGEKGPQASSVQLEGKHHVVG